jgi:uncharacterized protein (TIGR01370 family)
MFSLAKLGRAQVTEKWLVYYSDKAPVSAFTPYSTVIFDSRYHPPLSAIASAGVTTLGYVSIGEASPDYPYFSQLQSDGLLLQANPNWVGNRTVDLRDPRWTSRLCDEIVPAVRKRGFHGIFLDTVDSALYQEEQAPKQYKGMADAAQTLIRALRRANPGMPIAINRGYTILSGVAADIDIALGESVYTTYDFQSRKYKKVEEGGYRWQVNLLRAAITKNPRLRVFTLDYWDPADSAFIRGIYAEQRRNGFSPYVATIDLKSIVSEPE